MKKINVLSLFDGMSCGQIALKEMGIEVDKYFASEIDKHAIKQTQYNFPYTIQLGDVREVKPKDLPKIDLVLAGSPCQGFSFAGKQLNFQDERSKLFFEFVRIWEDVKEINPDAKFLLENVVMKKEYEKVISDYVGVLPVKINSSLVSAQTRKRLYWTNIRTKEIGLFGDVHSDIPQPKDRGIFIKDILQDESEVDEKYYLSDKVIANFKLYKQGINVIGSTKPDNCTRDGQRDLVYGSDGKMGCLMATDYKQPKQVGLLIPEATEKGYTEIQAGDCVDLEHPNSKTRRGRKMDKKSNTLMASQNSFCHYTKDYRLRRITPIEAARLQTIPDWYKWECSDTQVYKMLGNGWTVEVIKHILTYIN